MRSKLKKVRKFIPQSSEQHGASQTGNKVVSPPGRKNVFIQKVDPLYVATM